MNSSSTPLNVAALLQLQTEAAYRTRPQSHPVQQEFLDTSAASSDDGSMASHSSSSSNSRSPARGEPEPAQLYTSTTADSGSGAATDDWSTNGQGMVRFGHNLYYCARCASMVGLKR
ncbi:MAG: hypothetical protein M4579_007279 [Chaenotheca gracillima]|nr:MAG: hypothetical protein M4579_007279 [Chaenotheca gracillima]